MKYLHTSKIKVRIMTTESGRFELNKEDLISILKGAGIAFVGGGVAAVGIYLGNLDISSMVAPLVGAIAAVLINVGRKIWSDE